jgi:hypothetical protein
MPATLQQSSSDGGISLVIPEPDSPRLLNERKLLARLQTDMIRCFHSLKVHRFVVTAIEVAVVPMRTGSCLVYAVA